MFDDFERTSTNLKIILGVRYSTRVSRPPSNRNNLDKQKVESCTAWMVSFGAKYCSDKKEDKTNTDGTIVDLQITNLFLSMWELNALPKLRSLLSPEKLLDTPLKHFRTAIHKFTSPKKKVV